MSSSHYGKKQTTLLMATVYYRNEANEIKHTFQAFISDYLSHNDMFYTKAFKILIENLRALVPYTIERWINVTDGGNHFISRFAYWNLDAISNEFGLFLL